MDWIKHISYVLDLDVYLDVLKATMDELTGPFEEIRREVEFQERQRWRPAKEVADWLRRVEAIKQEVDEALEEGERKSSLYCLAGLCPWNIWDSYMLGKRVDEKQTALDSLLSEANSIYRAVYGSGSPISDLVRYAERYTENADTLLEEARDQGRRQPQMRRWWPRGSR